MNDHDENDDDDFTRRFARRRPAELPDDFFRLLAAAEPAPCTPRHWLLRWPAFLHPRPDSPWPLAYAGLLAVWLLIFGLRLATPPAPPPVAYSPAAPVLGGLPSTLLAVDGSPVDPAALFASNRPSAPADSQP